MAVDPCQWQFRVLRVWGLGSRFGFIFNERRSGEFLASCIDVLKSLELAILRELRVSLGFVPSVSYVPIWVPCYNPSMHTF